MAVSYSQIREAIRAHLNPNDLQGRSTWRYYVMDVYPGYAIVEDSLESCYYRVDYTVDDKDKVTVGARTKVKVEYVPVAESLRLTEAVSKDEGGKVWDVTIIRKGWSKNPPPNDAYYGEDVLAAAAPLYEGARAYADHPTKREMQERPERSIRDLVGWYENVRVEDGRLKAELHLFETAVSWLSPILREKPDMVGLSHHALGRAKLGEAEGRTGRIVEAIAKVVSVDVVTEGAAGGSFDRQLESHRSGIDGTENREEAPDTMEWNTVTLESLRQARPDLVQQIESAARQTARTEVEQSITNLRESVTTVSTENRTLRESVAKFQAEAAITKKLAGSNLPEPARARVQALVEAAIPMKDGALDTAALDAKLTEAITSEQDYLTKVGGSPVKGAGDNTTNTTLEEAMKNVEASLDRAFGVKSEEGGTK